MRCFVRTDLRCKLCMIGFVPSCIMYKIFGQTGWFGWSSNFQPRPGLHAHCTSPTGYDETRR